MPVAAIYVLELVVTALVTLAYNRGGRHRAVTSPVAVPGSGWVGLIAKVTMQGAGGSNQPYWHQLLSLFSAMEIDTQAFLLPLSAA